MIIPFFIPHSGCPHQCVFCNQKNITGQKTPPDLSLIAKKITEYVNTKTSDDRVQIAFYGGTFTALPLDLQQSYLEATQPFLKSGQIRSIRLSTRPDCINRQILEMLKRYHVDTVELGVQSMNDQVLTLSGRGHTAQDTVKAVKQLYEFSFNVGLQLMPGLPGDSGKIWMETVDKSIALKPDFVRIYPALVIKDTPLENLYKAGAYIPLSIEEAVAVCKDALLKFESAGIKVIRIGLQPTEALQKPGIVVSGPYHPAFRQLVESSILLDRMKAALLRRNNAADAVFLVHPGDISNAIGQKRSNIDVLKKQFGLKKVYLQPDKKVLRRTVTLAAS